MRSDSERQVSEWLTKSGIRWEYEKYVFKYTSRIKGGVCEECGAPAVQNRTYTPDFYLPDYLFHLEVKGQLSSSDRKKYRDFKKSNPNVDVRFLLLANNLLKAGDKDGGRYNDWCIKFGFQFYLRSLTLKDFGK